jgi:hypothetical protein
MATPSGEFEQDWTQLMATRGELVRLWSGRTAAHDAVAFEFLEPVRQHVLACGGQSQLQVGEPLGTEQQFPHHQQRPAFAGEVQSRVEEKPDDRDSDRGRTTPADLDGAGASGVRTEIVFATFAGARKIKALRARPAVAITIDTPTTPPEVLLLRGNAEVTDVDGVVAEYALAHRRYAGEEQGRKNVEEVDKPGLKMARIAVRPTWVGVLDFMTRLPGGITPQEFADRGRG